MFVVFNFMYNKGLDFSYKYNGEDDIVRSDDPILSRPALQNELKNICKEHNIEFSNEDGVFVIWKNRI